MSPLTVSSNFQKRGNCLLMNLILILTLTYFLNRTYLFDIHPFNFFLECELSIIYGDSCHYFFFFLRVNYMSLKLDVGSSSNKCESCMNYRFKKRDKTNFVLVIPNATSTAPKLKTC